MDARAPGLEGPRLQDLYCLHRGLFQTPTDRAQLRTAVYQVFGGQPWGGCCSDKLLEALLEAGQRGYLKQQLYWDFQLLDSDHDGYLSVRDAELLLAQVPRAHATGEAWQDFLRSRGPGVTWRDIEDWLFRASPLPVDGPHAGLRQSCHYEQGTSARVSTPLYQWGMKSRVEQLLERWDSGGLATLLGEEPSGVLTALERKYWVLQRKLCAEMLQVHYGQPAWALLPQNVKEDKLSELEALVDMGLRAGSILPLSSLPGAQHVIRSRAQTLKREANGGHAGLPAVEETAAQALQELRHRKQAETAATLAQRHLLIGSKPEASRRLLQLHAQTELVQQEASFQAALLAIELSLAERFWDSQSIVLEACHQELAQLRLAAGHGLEPAWRETKTVPGRSMMQVLLDRLLLQQERDRACLVQSLLTLAAPEMVQDRDCSRKQWNAPRTGCGEDMSPALQEAIAQMLKLAQKRLEVARRTEVLWQDCAIAVLMDLQHAQQEELSRTIEDLAGILSGRETLRVDLEASPAQELLLCELEGFTAKKMCQREEASGPPPKQSKMQVQRPHKMTSEPLPVQRNLQPEREGLGVHPQRGTEGSDPQLIVQPFQVPVVLQGESAPQKSQGPLLNKLETSEDQEYCGGPEGQRNAEAREASVASQVNQNLPQVQRIQAQKTGLQDLHTFQLQTGLLRKSKSLGSLEFVTLQPQVLMDPEIPLEIPKGEPHMLHFPEAGRREALDFQSHIDPQSISQRETEVIQADGMRKAMDFKPETSLKGKQEPLIPQEQEDAQVVLAQNGKGHENSQAHGMDVLQSQEWRGTESSSPRMKQEPLQIYKDPHKEYPALQILKTRDPQGPGQQEGGTPELSQLQGLLLLLKKSKSLDPQELSKPRANEPQGSPQRGREISAPKECRHSPEPQEWKESNAQAEQELKDLGDPYKTLVGGLQKGTEAFESQKGRKPDDFQSQELRQKLQSHQSEEPRIITGLQKIKKTQDFPVEEARAAKKTQSQKSQVAKPTLLNLRESQALQAHSETLPAQGIIPQRQTGAPPSQGSRSTESPPLMWRNLWQKAKSFELGKPCVFSTQELSNLELVLTHEMPQKELQVPQLQEMKRSFLAQSQEEPRMEPETHNKPQELRESELLYPPKLKEPKAPQTQREKALHFKEGVPTDLQALQHQRKRVSGIPQEVPQSRPQMHHSQEISWREPELPRPSGVIMQIKRKESKPHQPHKRKEVEFSQPKETIPLKETCVPQVQESRSPESPPLLWGMLGVKSKSFELRKPHAFETQVLRGLLLTQSQGRSQMEPEVHKPQRYKDSKVFSLQQLKEEEAPEIQAEKENMPIPERLLPEPYESQERRSPEIRQLQEAQKTPQRMTSRPENQEISQGVLEIPNGPGAIVQELRDPQALPPHKGECLEILQAQGTSEMMLQPRECKSPDTPPLLWRVLRLKAKSFELRKPRTFQTQKIESLKQDFLAQRMPQKELPAPQVQEVKRAQMVQPQGEPHVKPASHKSQEYEGPQVLDLQEFRETRAPSIQIEKETFHKQGMMPTDCQTFPPSRSREERGPGIPQCSLLGSKEMKDIQSQELRGLEDPEAQIHPQRMHMTSQSHKIPHQERGEAQAFQSQKTKNPEALQPQPTPEIEAGFLHPPEHQGPETPPLLWRVLKLKAKSFELRKPRTFQTQKIQYLEPVFLTPKMPKEPDEENNLETSQLQPASELETGFLQHVERKSPETPPLLWWVLEVVQQGMTHRELLASSQLQEMNKSPAIQPQGKQGILPQGENLHSGFLSSQRAQAQEMEVEPVPLPETQQRDPQDAERSPGDQNILVQKELRDLEPMPKPLQAQGLVQRDSEDCGPSDLRDSLARHPKEIPQSNPKSVEKIKLDDYSDLEPPGRDSKTKHLGAPRRLIGKSKSLDFREQQAPKAHELAEPESPQGESQKRPRVFQVQKNPQKKLRKPKPSKGPQTFKSQENSGPGIVQAQGSQQLIQPQGGSAEILPLQSTLKQKSEPPELMTPLPLQIQTLTVLQTLESPQMAPETRELQESTEPKTICPLGSREAERCEFRTEERLSEIHGLLQRDPQTVLIPETSLLQTALHQKSKPFEPQEQSKPDALQLGVSRKPDISQDPESPQRCPQILENQAEKELETVPLQETSQVMGNLLQATSMLKMESEPSVQKDLKGLEVSQSQEKQSETLEFTECADSSTQVPLEYKETKPLPLWGMLLGKSKSLDLGELQILQSNALRELENSGQQNRSSPKIGQSQTKMQNALNPQQFKDPVVLHSKALQVEEFLPQDQGDPQLQEECETQRTQQMELETLQAQEPLKSKVLCSQELRDAQICHPKGCRELKVLPLQNSQSEKESLQTQTDVQRLSEAVEVQGPMETHPLNPHEERNLESPPIMKGLLKKSKTLGPELPTRRDTFQNQHCRRPEGPQGQVILKLETQSYQLQGLVGQESHNMEVLQHQELLNVIEGGRDFSGRRNHDSQKNIHKMEEGTLKAQKSLHVSKNLPQEQVSSPLVTPPQLSLPHALPPHKVPQFGINLLQELGRLHNELEALKSHELKDERAFHSQETGELMKAENQIATDFCRTMGHQIPQHQQWRGIESHQPPLISTNKPEAQRTLPKQQQTFQPPQSQQRDQGPCQTSGILKIESDCSIESSKLKTSQAIQVQECLLDESPGMVGMRVPHVLQSQESREPVSLCLQESLQGESLQESLQAEGKVIEGEPGPTKIQEQHPLMLQGGLLRKSKSLEPQQLSRTWDFKSQGTRWADSLHPQARELNVQQLSSSQESLHNQSQAFHPQVTFPKNQNIPKEQEIRDTNILLAQHQTEPKAHQGEEQKILQLSEFRDVKLCQLCKEQERQREVETQTLEPWWLEESQAFQNQEWRRVETLLGDRPQLRTLSAPGMYQLDLEDLGPAILRRSLEASPPWEQENIESWKNAHRTALSPPSPRSHGEDLRQTSICVTQPRRPSGVSWPPPPRPPRREKAFIRLSRQEKEEALQRLADLQAEGERRHQRDKERQILRFQERLSIAKHRKSEDDLLEGSPTERWPLPAEPQGQQDQAGQKTALKRHLEKVKRERTYVMQSKRERNTLRFKELLNPLVSHSEERPKPGQPGDV
ncbi:hypothetical protein lerEdw1_020873 [Lerista edwardsae]|nr:hypothetical protein lerEdw1_020873 [Lerista edwardsae]